MTKPIALDTDILDRARALHRVWRALNDGDCPKCHRYHKATEMIRLVDNDSKRIRCLESVIKCPSCGFTVTAAEIADIEAMFAPAMDAAVAIFEEWRASRPIPT